MANEKFKFLEHATADAGFEATGASKEEMISNAGIALFSLMFEPLPTGGQLCKKIDIDIKDDAQLVHDFLSEALFQFQTNKSVFNDLHVTIDEKAKKMTAICCGIKFDRAAHKFALDVKAVTYHELKVWQDKKTWKCRVIVDI